MAPLLSCRLCLRPTNSKRLKAIYGSDGEIGRKIFLVSGVQIVDMLNFKETAMICEKCEDSLNNAVYFRDLCRKSDLIFREIVCDHEEQNWSKNLLALQFNIQKEEEEVIQSITAEDVKCEFIESILDPEYPMEVEKVDDESDYEYIAIEIKDDEPDFIDENETIEYLEEHADEIILPPKTKIDGRRRKRLPAPPGDEGYYQCHICGKDDIPTKNSYNGHLHRHKIADARKNYQKLCIRCEPSVHFGSHVRLEEHIALMHPTVYACDYCGGVSRNRASFTKHIIEEARKARPYLCSICGESFRNLARLKAHKKTHEPELLHFASGFANEDNDDDELKIKCKICGCILPNPHSLMRHKKKYHRDPDKKTRKIEYLEEYSNEALSQTKIDGRKRKRVPAPPGKEGYLRCELCGKDDIPTRVSLFSHMYRHKKNESRNGYEKKCIRCGDKFHTHVGLEEHIQKEHPATYTCHLCGSTFTNRLKFTKHIVDEARNGRHYYCSTCGNTFKNRTRLKAHKKMHAFWKDPEPEAKENVDDNFDENDDLKCKICGCFQLNSNQFRKHMKKHKEAGEKVIRTKYYDLKCKFCGHVAPHTHAARMHLYNHRKVNVEKNIYCTWNGCNDTFISYIALKFHLYKKHNQRLQFQCDYCDKEPFNTKTKLLIHMKGKHLNKKIKMNNRTKTEIPCSICGKIFTTLYGLKGHESRHLRSELKTYYCDLCGNRYSEKGKLQNHIKFVHIKNRLYYCDKCPGKSWKVKFCRDNHVKTIHEGIKYSCHICGRSYNTPGNLRYHLKYHNSYLDGQGTRRTMLRPESHYQKLREYKIRKKMEKLNA